MSQHISRYSSKYNLVWWPEDSGSQLYYVNLKIETGSHTHSDKVIFITIREGIHIIVFFISSQRNILWVLILEAPRRGLLIGPQNMFPPESDKKKDPISQKTYFRTCAVRPAKIQISLRILSLIRIFTEGSLVSQGCKNSSCRQRRLISLVAQADLTSRKHVYLSLTPLNPLLYSKTRVYRGIHYFSYFAKT